MLPNAPTLRRSSGGAPPARPVSLPNPLSRKRPRRRRFRLSRARAAICGWCSAAGAPLRRHVRLRATVRRRCLSLRGDRPQFAARLCGDHPACTVSPEAEAGRRSVLIVPRKKENKIAGAFTVARHKVMPVTEKADPTGQELSPRNRARLPPGGPFGIDRKRR